MTFFLRKVLTATPEMLPMPGHSFLSLFLPNGNFKKYIVNKNRLYQNNSKTILQLNDRCT